MEQQNKEAVESIIAHFKCPKGFKCYSAGVEDLCKAKQAEGTVSYLECLEATPQDCVFAKLVQGWDTYVCTCPLRKYMADKLKK